VNAGPPAGELLPAAHSEAGTLEEALQGAERPPKWIGWRLRALVVIVLLGILGIGLVAQWLSTQPRLPIALRATPEGMVKLSAANTPALQRLEGQTLEGLRLETRDAQGQSTVWSVPVEVLALQKSARWVPQASERQAMMGLHQRLDELAHLLPPEGGAVTLELQNLPDEPVLVAPRGWQGLTPLFWFLSALSLVLLGVGAVVLLAGLQWRNAAFMVLVLTQAGQLMLTAVESNLDIFAPPWFLKMDCTLRMALDLVSAAAMIQVAALHPRPLRQWPIFAMGGWTLALLVGMSLTQLPASNWWPWLQATTSGMVMITLWLMQLAYRQSPHPFTLVLGRFTAITLGCWVLLSVAIATHGDRPDMQLNLATFGVMTWHVFFASQLLLSPYLTRSKQILQEFSLLAASSTVAASLDLIFVAVFSLGQFTSMTLSLFLSFGVYLSIRRWVMTHLLSRDSLSTERLFERLYRIARELERQPERINELMGRLMRELFDPLESAVVKGEVSASTIRGNGGLLLVRLPHLHGEPVAATQVLVLRHANKGRRLFTSEDARLATRIMEQLQRVLSFDRAVEQGRSEERLRIAQDLHDDIGARLLTLMYQAPNPDIEDYIRHTLQDLKTLTRGLSVQGQTLVDAASEWKRDISHRLQAARAELQWSATFDQNIALTVVQWSALTRILRELVNNTISHAKAKKVSIDIVLKEDRLTLHIRDDGVGRQPETWSHGLGLGGVRKRTKQLGGTVTWSEIEPVGIACEVVVESFSQSAGHTSSSGN
jgi:signal transduction histidine kinase